MKKRSCLTRTDLGTSPVLKRTESDQCWKKSNKPSAIHPFKGDEPQENCLNVYQQLTRSYSWLKQNVFNNPDAESIAISNKKIKHVLKEFNNKDFVVQNLAMGSKSVEEDPDDSKRNLRPASDHKYHTFLKKHRNESDTRYDGSNDEEEKPPEEQDENRPLSAEKSGPSTLPDSGEKEKLPEEKGKNKKAHKSKVDKAPKTPESIKSEDKEKGKEESSKPQKHEEVKDVKDKKTKLTEADQRAKNMAKFIEEMRASLAEYAKKEEMTEEDAKEMLRKQEELMAKLSEFEEITKHVQDLAGIENVSSSLLGIPVQCREVNPCGPSRFDNFPKVICFDRISQHELGVPNMIVCEPVCKEKDPCGGLSQSTGRKSPCNDQIPSASRTKKGYTAEQDPERYIQKELSRELQSTEVLGMLDRQGMLTQTNQAVTRPIHPGMAGPHPGMMGLPPGMVGMPSGMMGMPPGMMGMPPGMMGMSPGMMGMPPGMMNMMPPGIMRQPNQPEMLCPPGQVGMVMLGMSGPVSQPGAIWPQPGVMNPQRMLGSEGQLRMIGMQPQHAMVNPQGVLKPISPKQGMIRLKEPCSGEKTPLPATKDKEGEPEITIRQKELVSMQSTKKIVGGDQFVSEHKETDKAKETSIEVGPTRKSKNGGGSQKEMRSPANENIDGLKKQLEVLQTEMKGVRAENVNLQKRVMMCSPEATKQMLRHCTEVPLICRKTLSTKPICKLDLYRQLNLPLPSPLGSAPFKAKGGIPQPLLQLPVQEPGDKRDSGKCQRELTSKVLCRLDIYKKFGQVDEGKATRDMETMVSSIEDEVKVIKKELNTVIDEKHQLEMQKKLLTCTAPAIASQSGKGGGMGSTYHPFGTKGTQLSYQHAGHDATFIPKLPIRDLREQYNTLQQDYQLKVEETTMLRVELESARKESLVSIEKSEEAEARVDELIARLKTVEDEKSKITSNKDQLIELEQQLVLAKQRYKEINEELEDLRSQITDQTMQTEDYRKKYLVAQENVEEQKRQIEMMELESSRFGEQVAIELQRVKAQFHSKLEELAPLPELLKKTQEKLKETIHLKTLAEKNCLIMSQNLELANEQKEKLKQQLDEIKKNKNESEAEKASLKINLTDGEKKMEETKAENDKLRASISKLEELALSSKRKYEEKVQEGLQLQSQLETLREESARQVARIKDRYENMRKTLQNQIFELENQLAATRASAKAAQKDRDDIRQKMQAQIIQLNENFEQAQMRIRSLQAHVNYLKTSYTNIFAPPEKVDSNFLQP